MVHMFIQKENIYENVRFFLAKAVKIQHVQQNKTVCVKEFCKTHDSKQKLDWEYIYIYIYVWNMVTYKNNEAK